MKIKQYQEFYYGFKTFSFFDVKIYIKSNNIEYLSYFLRCDFGSLASRDQLEKNINYYFIEGIGTGLQSTQISVDKKNDLIYIGVMPDPCDDDSEVYEPINNYKTRLDLF
ncbi:hypothetical protein KBC04_02450, partial [Candidatus Babeliales bacterium]|nr:hypothetical protein [Candidatus Babeliales bacterium]